jgi:translation initiation factor 3 subunit E
MAQEDPQPADEATSPEDAAELARYDLCSKMSPFLDRHLILPILIFVKELDVYKSDDITRAEIELLKDTNMIDFIAEKYQTIGEEAPASLMDRREGLLTTLEESREKVFKLLQILEVQESLDRIPGCKSLEDFYKEFELDDKVLDELLLYTKLMYECGDYALASELLKHYKTIIAVDVERAVNKDTISSLWGQLASNILSKDFKVAAELILDIHDKLEKAEKAESAQQKMPMREVLLQRTWWLHWALYAVFNSEEVDPKVLDFFLNEKSLSIISLSCPYLFRYVGACLILNKRLKLVLFDAVKVLQHECGSYSDPITRFLLALYTDMDFDEAQRELQKCRLVCKGDYFLSAQWAEFEENARLLIFERYCRIHQCINIQMIAEKLNMAPEEAELWIVKLIQSAKLDARIDSEKSRVVMSKAPPSVYQQVIEKTKNLSFRSTMTLANLEKSANDRAEMRPGM